MNLLHSTRPTLCPTCEKKPSWKHYPYGSRSLVSHAFKGPIGRSQLGTNTIRLDQGPTVGGKSLREFQKLSETHTTTLGPVLGGRWQRIRGSSHVFKSMAGEGMSSVFYTTMPRILQSIANRKLTHFADRKFGHPQRWRAMAFVCHTS